MAGEGAGAESVPSCLSREAPASFGRIVQAPSAKDGRCAVANARRVSPTGRPRPPT